MKRRIRLALTAAAIALLVGLAAWRWAGRQAQVEPGERLPDLAARLRERLPGLCVVPARPDGDYCAGAYLCDSPRRLEELVWLRRNPRCAAMWTGVVFCEHTALWGRVISDDWGENGCQVGPFVFFGDATLIARIREALR